MSRTAGTIAWLLILLSVVGSYAQDAKSFQLLLPTQANWNTVPEGSTIQFDLKTNAVPTDTIIYSFGDNKQEGMRLDSLGHFSWTPGFDLADRIQTTKTYPVTFEARNRRGQMASQTVDFKVMHVNRPPVVGDLQPFYVSYRTQNTYKIDPEIVHDDDGDPIAFIPIADQMPEGSKLSSQGELTWTLSLNQFNRLKQNPQYIEFWVEDQPAKTRTKGRLKVQVTEMDLPPIIQIIPKETHYKLKENATVNLKFYLSDPNGEDDVTTFGFLSDNQQIPKTSLVKNTDNQYEFIWQPGYDFVKDPYDSLNTQITFYALDKAKNREERRITFTVINTVNELEKDRYYYSLYRQLLVQAWGLVEQLGEKEEQLKKDYKRAKGGKRNRSVANASLGAVTGVSPAITADRPDQQRLISAIGGTAVLTMGTLEATEVIGKSMKDLLDRYNYVLGKKSELQNKGDVFAREFSLKSSRRSNEFVKKLDDFRSAMSLSGLVALELDANWQSKKEASDKAIKRTFKDFTPLEETQ
ncbi:MULTISPECIES: hypothetical protein [Spirosoma]|uniref:Cadherin repeat domain-containing protein n=1 Tax=Spirosoma liriopis TaxID=2937440 RepID=A0ABT0HJ89_9BACT|nr:MULTISPECIES: hypothetical protein [Spirosoma]MCK8492227.1 hypothetical protein [Spirosoma liriopis]UHG91642.1 hypothetical protein LQ777_01805 [Spirosoma oryzicola]